MIRYRKGLCPPPLAAFAAAPDGDWDDFKDKQEVRDALVRDQGQLCAYCQREISPGPLTMKIDHWVPQKDPVDGTKKMFEWTNLLGACPGETRRASARSFHCDTKRGQLRVDRQRLYLHPVDGQGPDPRRHLRYQANGAASAYPDDERVWNDIDILGLNCTPLKEARAQVLERLEQRLKRLGFTPKHVQRLLDELDQVTPTPYIEVARDYLRRKLRRLS